MLLHIVMALKRINKVSWRQEGLVDSSLAAMSTEEAEGGRERSLCKGRTAVVSQGSFFRVSLSVFSVSP